MNRVTALLDAIREKLTVHPKWTRPLVSLAVGYFQDVEITQHHRDYDASDDQQFQLRNWGARLVIGGGDAESLYQNAVFFVRINLIGVWWLIRGKQHVHMGGVGYKLSGVIGANFRFQTDESAARGVTGANYNQATGLKMGPK